MFHLWAMSVDFQPTNVRTLTHLYFSPFPLPLPPPDFFGCIIFTQERLIIFTFHSFTTIPTVVWLVLCLNGIGAHQCSFSMTSPFLHLESSLHWWGFVVKYSVFLQVSQILACFKWSASLYLKGIPIKKFGVISFPQIFPDIAPLSSGIECCFGGSQRLTNVYSLCMTCFFSLGIFKILSFTLKFSNVTNIYCNQCIAQGRNSDTNTK